MGLRQIIDLIPEMLFVKDADGRFLLVNQTIARSYNLSVEELTGRLHSDIHPDKAEVAKMLAADRQVIETGMPIFIPEESFLGADGKTRYLQTKKIPFYFAETGKPTILGIAVDITDRKSSEEERLHFEQKLFHTQKLESLGVLAGGIAHDFNNILTSIIGNAELALMRMAPESPGIKNLHKIEQAAARAADLAKQMLAYSGKGTFIVENLDINCLLEEMLHMLEVSISKKVDLRLDLTPNLPAVEADATQMRQIVMNLVINASEAIGERNGVIAIATGCIDRDNNYLKDYELANNSKASRYVFLEISDTGCGMDKETQAKIFDPFFTTKFTGRGLGMAAVLGIVRGHRGAIKVYSEPGKGTTFKILLPASYKQIEATNDEAYKDDWHGSGTVLLVDDEETVRDVGTEMLKELGFSPITASDGREALEIFRLTPNIAFVILDMTMPQMDGEQCFRELKQLKPDVKVIISTGFSELEATQKFGDKGLVGFIQKPYKMSLLKKVIKMI
jgi:PAS domain S-box-containing protein